MDIIQPLEESSLPSPRPHDVTDADAQQPDVAQPQNADVDESSLTSAPPRDDDDDGAQVADICFAHCS